MPPDDPAPVRGPSRSFPIALVVAAVVLLVARIGTGMWEQRNPPEVPDLVRWRPIEAAEAESRATGRPILYDFNAAWCGPCQAMKREVFGDPRSAAQINRLYVPVSVVDRSREDGHNPPDVQALQDRYKIDAFPTLVVFSPTTGHTETFAGYGGAQATLQQLGASAFQFRMGGSAHGMGAAPDSVTGH